MAKLSNHYRFAGFALILLALALIAASWPVEGLAGAGLALGGFALLWTGWYLIVRRAGRIDAQHRHAAETASVIRNIGR